MSRVRAQTSPRFLLFAMLVLFTCESHAHLLNMTELHLDASDPRQARLHVKIDLGQSLMLHEIYWRAVSADAAGQASAPFPAGGIAPAEDTALDAPAASEAAPEGLPPEWDGELPCSTDRCDPPSMHSRRCRGGPYPTSFPPMPEREGGDPR